MSNDDLKRDSVHVRYIKGIPVEVKSLDIVDGVLQERVPRSDSHESIVEPNRESRRGYPVNGKEEVKRC